jgi:hypothetical protein
MKGHLKVMKIFKLFTIIIGVVLLFIVVPSCKISEGLGNNSNDSYFQELQKNTPFAIILPRYLPADILTRPAIAGPKEDSVFKGGIWIELSYYQKDGNIVRIIIREENLEIDNVPSGDSSTLFKINGIQVLEEDTKMGLPKSSDSINGFYYAWNQNGINMNVRIFGYSKNESRKVIESIVK